MKKIMITGGLGMLATDLTDYLQGKGCDVHALSRQNLDVTDGAQVLDAVKALKPNAVIHTAAMHVDPCEEDPEAAYGSNAWATRHVARACEQAGSTMVYISTCGLFGDKLKSYTEYDPVVLKTEYARSKYAGEEFVRQFCDSHVIVRPGWLFGGRVDHKKNFVVQRFKEASKVDVVNSVYDKHGSPTYTGDLARGIDALLETGEVGTYHVVNQGGGSRAAYVRQIIASFGLDTTVEEVDSSHFPRKADVPDCEILDGFNLRYAGIESLPPWEEAIDRYVQSIRDQITA